MMVSSDGYVDGSDSEQNWHNWNEEMSAYMMGFFQTVDNFIYGRKSYEEMIQYWPPLSGDFANIMNCTPNLVHSRTLKEAEWNATIKNEVNSDEITAMKKQPGKDMVIFAGPSLAGEYIRYGLVDEFRIIVNPVVLGFGKMYFPSVVSPFNLSLVSTKTFDCGNVLLIYKPI